MQTFTTVDLLKALKTVTLAAAKAPVAITQYRKARYVLMTMEDFERISGRDPRQVYRTGDMPGDVRDEVLKAIDQILTEDNSDR